MAPSDWCAYWTTAVNGQDYKEYWELLKQVLVKKLELDEVMPRGHAQEQMHKRGILKDDVAMILLENDPVEMHAAYSYPYSDPPCSNPDPVFTVVGHVGEQWVAVALAVKPVFKHRDIDFYVVTVIAPLEQHSRHLRHAKKGFPRNENPV